MAYLTFTALFTLARAFWPTQIEALLYASLMGIAAAWFVF